MTAAEYSLVRNTGNKRRNQSAFPRLEILIILINPVNSQLNQTASGITNVAK